MTVTDDPTQSRAATRVHVRAAEPNGTSVCRVLTARETGAYTQTLAGAYDTHPATDCPHTRRR